MTEYKPTELEQAWREFISRYNFQWFCTFTFKTDTHPEAADKAFKYFIKQMNYKLCNTRNIHRKSQIKKTVHWVRALEYQKRGVIHYHALLANIGYEDRHFWESIWRNIGGFARFDTYDSSGVVDYICKYVSKGGQIDVSEHIHLTQCLPLAD